jgi:hypothetical protein
MANDPREKTEEPGRDLRSERDEVLQRFTRGSSFARELLQDYEALEQRLRTLEGENAKLRATIEADHAVRDLLKKIETLELEKAELVSRFNRVEALQSNVSSRMTEAEHEFSNLANLFVASTQLSSSLSPRAVTRRIKEILAQLVGAEAYAMYLVNADGTELQIDERFVGVIAIFSTLAQKPRFSTVDFELFRLLGRQAAVALVGAGLFMRAEHKLPGLEAFLDLSV